MSSTNSEHTLTPWRENMNGDIVDGNGAMIGHVGTEVDAAFTGLSVNEYQSIQRFRSAHEEFYCSR